MSKIIQRIENLTGGLDSATSSLELPLAVGVEVVASFVEAALKTDFNLPVKDNVDTEDIPLAVLSKVSYDNYFTGDTTEAQKMIDDYNIGYNIVEDLTEKEYLTAVNPQDKKVVIAFKGTDPKNIYDDIADVEIGLGLAETPILSYIPSRFNTAENIYKEVKNKYPDYEINLTGHSLGGTTARYIGDRYNEKAVVFSAGATPLEPFLNKELEIAPSKAKFYLTDTLDVISNTSRLTEHDVNIVKTKDAYRKYFTGSHSIENYLPEITKINPISKKINENEIIPKTIKTQFNQISKEILMKKMDKIKERNENTNVSNEPFRKSLCELKPYLCYDEKK
jgi:esterase/lipase